LIHIIIFYYHILTLIMINFILFELIIFLLIDIIIIVSHAIIDFILLLIHDYLGVMYIIFDTLKMVNSSLKSHQTIIFF
jgi:hypothetical protein